MNKRALRDGELIARRSIFSLLILSAIKAAAGIITGMHIMIADAVATFADTLGVFASYFGLRLSRRSADKNFGYGYYKIETFAALVVSIGIIWAGYAILRDSFATLQNPIEGQYRPFALTATVISIYFSMRLAKRLQDAGEKVNSLSLIANAKDKKMDFYSGFVILVSIIANYKSIPYIEGVVSMIIAVLILRTGIMSTKESLFFLLDYWDDPILVKRIRKVFAKEHGVVSKVIEIKLRRAGTFIFGEAFVEINPYSGLQDLRDELEVLKKNIQALNPYIKDFSIHTHISKTENAKIAAPIESGNGLNAKIATTLKKTQAYIFVEIRKGKIHKHYKKKLKKEDKSPVPLTEYLKAEKINIVINNNLNSLIYYNLRRTNQILVYPNLSNLKTVEQSVKLLLLDT
ncbi:cation transporter [Candidatus Peregrinibacteria bacterium]|jgi:cation diffusion facilitator family transporter|nr:cation transporter [Candidatus Peregrinibacteria bacterium]MBT7736787.1 cation transporter [Candidatus Peregrinibacteria bacterium]